MINAKHEDLIGKPIESAQTFLRVIAYDYKDLPLVFPDGIYGEQTRVAVEAFQTKFGPEVTGEINFATWERIIEIYDDVLLRNRVDGVIYPDSVFMIMPGEENEQLEIMQHMMKEIAGEYNNLRDIKVSGVHDEGSVELVKGLQEQFGMEPTGVIDNVFWNRVERLYKNSVSRNPERILKTN